MSDKKQPSNQTNQTQELKQAARNEALSAAEKGLEAAREALEQAEQKLAEAQQSCESAEQQQSTESVGAASANPAGNTQNQGYWQGQAAQGGYQYQPAQPSYTAVNPSSKDHVAAGLLAIFLGTFGIHKFYLGYNTQGFIMLAISILAGVFTFGIAAGVIWVIAVIEGVLYLTKNQSDFERIYVYNKREWF